MVESFEGTGALSWADVQLRPQRRMTAQMRSNRRSLADPSVNSAVSSSSSVWINLKSHSVPEHWVFVLLAVAAMAGIIYGFCCLTDLVQNWASFSSGVDKLIL